MNFIFSIRLKELKFSNTTQRIQFFSDLTQSIELFLYDTLWIELFLFQEIWLDSSNWTSFYEPLFKMTQRVEVFLSDSKNWTFLVFQCDSKNWNLFSQNVSKNLTSLSWELFLHDSKNLIFSIWLKEFNLLLFDSKNWAFSYLTQCIELFPCLPQRIEPYSKYGSMNWIGFSNVTQRIELFSLMWLTELTFFFFVRLSELNFLKYDSRKWTYFFFSNMTQRFFQKTSKNWMFFQYFSKNWFFFDSKDWIFFLTTQRIEPFFVWLKELNLFSQYDSKNWTFFFFNMTQRVELLFWIWLKELNLFDFDSKNWTFYWVWFKELNLFFSMTQRMELLFEYDSVNRSHFFECDSQIEIFGSKIVKILIFFF